MSDILSTFFQEFTAEDGTIFSTKDLPLSTPSKFAIAFVKRMKGDAYLEQVSFQDDAKKTKASSDFVDLLKSENSFIFFVPPFIYQ